jgi:hypothetical protein
MMRTKNDDRKKEKKNDRIREERSTVNEIYFTFLSFLLYMTEHQEPEPLFFLLVRASRTS